MTELSNATQGLFWSAWTELGIPGAGRRHAQVALDVEALIAFSPHFLERDPRLMGLVFDWCACHASWVSKTRLARLARLAPEPVRAALGAFNGALRKVGVDWRPSDSEHPWSLERDRAVVALPLERDALIGLRLRAVAGVSTRADVLSRLLALSPHAALASQIVPPGVSRRSAERTLADLASSRVVVVEGDARNRLFRLREVSAWHRIVGGEGLVWLDWTEVLLILADLHALVLEPAKSAAVRRVDAVRAARGLGERCRRLRWEEPPPLAGRPDAFEALEDWGVRVSRALADGRLAELCEGHS